MKTNTDQAKIAANLVQQNKPFKFDGTKVFASSMFVKYKAVNNMFNFHIVSDSIDKAKMSFIGKQDAEVNKMHRLLLSELEKWPLQQRNFAEPRLSENFNLPVIRLDSFVLFKTQENLNEFLDYSNTRESPLYRVLIPAK